MIKGRESKGFTLLELAVAVAILSLMTVSILAIIPQQQDQKNIDNTNANMGKIQAAIDAYVNQFGFLPCPAPLNAAVASANYGVSANCTLATPPAGITNIAGATANENVWLGAVPTRTLGLSDSSMNDNWEGRIEYAVVNVLAQTKSNFQNYSTNQQYVIRINDANSNPISQPVIAPNLNVVAYVLLSHGKNSNGVTSSVGDFVHSCPATGVDKQNCSHTSTFVDAFFNTNTATYYDDIIRWKTLQQQARDATNGGGLGAGVSVNNNPGTTTSGFSKMAFIADVETGSTNGGACTPGGWVTRTLNTIVFNTLASVSLAGNVITLGPGTYVINASAPANNVNFTKVRLYNVTAGSTIAVGEASYTQSGGGKGTSSLVIVRSAVTAYLSLTSTTNIRLDHYCATTGGTQDLGFGVTTGGADDTYTYAEVQILGYQ